MYLWNGFLTLKWKYWAQSIKKAIDNDEINKSSVYQIPKISIVANEIFNAPIMFLVRLDNSYNWNSKSILSLRKTHTTMTDIETVNWANIIICSILLF